MNRETFDKMFKNGCALNVGDLSVEEKSHLYNLLKRHGASLGFSYARFFRDGFREWELQGIDMIKSDFLKKHEKEIVINLPVKRREGEDDSDVTIFDLDYSKPGAFYNVLGLAKGLKKSFSLMMQEKGMSSNATILKRFSTDDWRPFEQIGIRAIIEEFCK